MLPSGWADSAEQAPAHELLDAPLASGSAADDASSGASDAELQFERHTLHSALLHYVGDQAHALTGVPCAKWWSGRDVEGGSEGEERGEAAPLDPLDADAAPYAEEVPDVFALATAPNGDGGASGDDLVAESSLAAIECPAMRTLVLRFVAFVCTGTHTLRRRAAAALGKIALALEAACRKESEDVLGRQQLTRAEASAWRQL